VDDHGFVDNEVELKITGIELLGVNGEAIAVSLKVPQVAHMASGRVACVATPQRIEVSSCC
jgi:hypothetical protein